MDVYEDKSLPMLGKAECNTDTVPNLTANDLGTSANKCDSGTVSKLGGN